MEDTPTGAWIVYGWDMCAYPIALFLNEIDALRFLADHGYGQVKFWEWGEWS